MGLCNSTWGFFNSRSWGKKAIKQVQQPLSAVKELCRQFSEAEMKSATNNFDPSWIIGEGEFGMVYVGYVNESSMKVAIKRCKNISEVRLSEFKNQAYLLSQFDHPNILPLVGYCLDRKELFIVYNYMPNGSLDDHLHIGENTQQQLGWKMRLRVCIGVARGLQYLHSLGKYVLIHRALNTRNILLDQNWEPRICGLLLSKMGPLTSASKSLVPVKTRVFGTNEYADPEYVATGRLTEKSDIYSLGVVLLEVVSAKLARDLFNEYLEDGHGGSLKVYAEKIIDPSLKSEITPSCWKAFIDITERCLLPIGRDRPDIAQVELQLNRALQLQEE